MTLDDPDLIQAREQLAQCEQDASDLTRENLALRQRIADLEAAIATAYRHLRGSMYPDAAAVEALERMLAQ